MVDGDRFELKNGGGCMMLFGLPFFVAGLAVICVTVVPGLVNDGPPLFFGIPFGGIFAIVGASIMFGRSKLVIDKIRGVVSKQWSLIIPLRNKEYGISDFTNVLVTKEVRRSDKSTYTVYPVYLGGADRLSIKESQNYNESRQLSEQLSKFLDFDVVDGSSGEDVVRKAGTMDKSVRDQLLESGEEIVVPDEPANMKTESYMQGDSLVVEVPPVGFSPASLIGLLPLFFIVPFFGIFGTVFLSSDNAPPLIFKAFIGIFACVFLAVPLTMVYKLMITPLFARAKLELSKYELKYTTSAIFSKTVCLNCDEIEELLIEGEVEFGDENSQQQVPEFAKKMARSFGKGGGGILIRTDAMSLNIGAHLSPQEQAYIIAAMKQTLVS